uniref:Uncharacterized protein n=1 Tax=Arundo donax TaxID=35708 RepID=A0A0A8Y284_ARUDO
MLKTKMSYMRERRTVMVGVISLQNIQNGSQLQVALLETAPSNNRTTTFWHHILPYLSQNPKCADMEQFQKLKYITSVICASRSS